MVGWIIGIGIVMFVGFLHAIALELVRDAKAKGGENS